MRSRAFRRPITAAAALVASLGLAVAATLVPGSPAQAARGDIAFTKVTTTVRDAPTTAGFAEAELVPGQSVNVLCWTPGEPTYGTDKYGSMWLKVSGNAATGYSIGYVHSFLVSPVNVAEC